MKYQNGDLFGTPRYFWIPRYKESINANKPAPLINTPKGKNANPTSNPINDKMPVGISDIATTAKTEVNFESGVFAILTTTNKSPDNISKNAANTKKAIAPNPRYSLKFISTPEVILALNHRIKLNACIKDTAKRTIHAEVKEIFLENAEIGFEENQDLIV